LEKILILTEFKVAVNSVWLLLFARYPTLEEFESFSSDLEILGLETAVKTFNQIHYQLQFYKGSKVKLIFAKEAHNYIDVTHTVGFSFNTGIQRVVRKLSEEIQIQNNIEFFPLVVK
jgi:hypothetical protein